MPNTARLAMPYPTAADIPDGPAQIQALAARVDAICAMYAQGTAAAKPAAGIPGRLYLATDTGELSMDNGSQWFAMTPATSAKMADIGDLKFSIKKNEAGGWIFADGRSLAAGVYPNLRQLLADDGNPFGVSGSNPLLPDLKGRVPLGAGAGAGLTVRAIGQNGGVEAHPLVTAELAAHSHTGSTGNDSPDHSHGYNKPSEDYFINAAGGALRASGKVTEYGPYSTGGASARHTHAFTTNNSGSGTAHPNVQPFTVCQWYVYAGSAS